jgi:hypothetical protein
MDPATSSRTFALRGTPRKPGALTTVEPKPPPARGAPKAPRRTLVDFIPGGANLDEATKAKMTVVSKRLEAGPTARVPMLCKGPQCPFIGLCELSRSNIPLPLDQECPIELFVIDGWKERFLEGIEVEKQENSVWITQLVEDLAIEVALQTRMLGKLAMEPDPIQKSAIGINFKGDPIEMKQLHPGMDLLLRVHDRKLRKLRELLGTPRSKAEAGRLGFNDPSSKVAEAQAAAAAALANIGGGTMSPRTGPAKLGDFASRD